jgi:hypothetical protein
MKTVRNNLNYAGVKFGLSPKETTKFEDVCEQGTKENIYGPKGQKVTEGRR